MKRSPGPNENCGLDTPAVFHHSQIGDTQFTLGNRASIDLPGAGRNHLRTGFLTQAQGGLHV